MWQQSRSGMKKYLSPRRQDAKENQRRFLCSELSALFSSLASWRLGESIFLLFTLPLAALCFANSASAEITQQQLDAALAKVDGKIVAWRRDIHEHPELSGQHPFTYLRRYPMASIAFTFPFGTSGVRISAFARYLNLHIEQYDGSLLAAEQPPGSNGGEEVQFGFGVLLDRRKSWLGDSPGHNTLREYFGSDGRPMERGICSQAGHAWLCAVEQCRRHNDGPAHHQPT